MTRWYSAAVFLLLAGCLDERPFGATGPDDAGVTLTPSAFFLEPGTSLPLAAASRLPNGGTVRWTSSDPEVAEVSAGGVVTAIGVGLAEITADDGRGTGRSRVTVVQPTVPVRSWRRLSEGLTDVSLLGLWSADPSTTFAVGQFGLILRSVDAGVTWQRMAVPDTVSLVGVWGAAPNDVWAVGTGGAILRYNGTAWSRVPSPTTATLLEVWGLSATEVYAVGAGVALRYDGTTWKTLPGAEGFELWAVWGTSRFDLHAAGQNGVLLRFDGATWRQVSSPTALLLLGLWGSSSSNVYAVGIQGTLLRWDGVAWTPVTLPTRQDFFAIWGSHAGDILLAGNHGTLVRFNGTAWTLEPQQAAGVNLRAIHRSASGGDFTVAGWDGTVLVHEPAGWRVGTAGPFYFDVAPGPGGLFYAIGSSGAVSRGQASTWTRLRSPTVRSLFGAARVGEDLVVVGDSGTILRYDGVAWRDESIPVDYALRSIWADESGQAFIVGDRGASLRLLTGRWTVTPTPTARFLRHVFGLSPSDVYAVGDSGTIIHWDGAEWRRMSSPTGALLRGVWGSGPRDLFAVGDGGAAIRYDGVRWYLLNSTTQRNLRAVWGTGPTEVYAVGEGRILRFDGARWSVLPAPNDLFYLAIEAGDGAPMAVGSRGAILEGVR